ncbi:MAG TPA: lipid-A-disaccharide synthase N-terminal domain-containing protein [Bdellovibrionota bacterium]|jgi:lipid-A-disaccharide synthase-like uncharacterized protein|nr:lipid-A-disaccharide synthase N-terminal domain-containing protein [Bdellovibrionota bacterium]
MNLSFLKEFELDFWSIIGFLGQFFFFLRFFVQWVASEKKGESYIPLSFWYYSILGTTILGAYAYVRRDLVFFLASILNLGIYMRNLKLINNTKAAS